MNTPFTNQSLADACFVMNTEALRRFMLCFLSVVFMLFVMQPAQADRLFDFQMKLAEKGNAEAQYKIGEMYETGFGVKKDMEQAQYWINKSAKQGHEVAGYKLLYWDLQSGSKSAESKEKLAGLQKQADSGNSYAQYYIGKMSANGVGLRKNLEQAQTMLNRAAIQGVLEAERELVQVRENIQRAAIAKRKAEAKRQAALKKKREAERQKKLAAAAAEKARKAEEARKAAALKQLQQEEQRKEAARQAEQKLKQASEEEQRRAEREALERQREARRQELLSQRREREAERKAKFESDPCSGKSARFLSTCR